jgi:hypothetical protein
VTLAAMEGKFVGSSRAGVAVIELANKAYLLYVSQDFCVKSQTAQNNDVFELFCERRKCNAFIQIPFQSDL